MVMFAFSSAYLPKYLLEKFDLENVGQGHGVQHSQWSYSIVNINLYKVIIEHFSLALTGFRNIHILKFVILKMQVKVMIYNSRSGAIRWQIHDYLMAVVMFALSHRFRDFNVSNV